MNAKLAGWSSSWSRRARLLLAIASLSATASPDALAQEARTHDLPDLEREVQEAGFLEHVKVRFKLANRFIGNADFGNFDADSYQPEGRLRITVPLSKNAGIRLMGSGRALIYDFDNDSDLGLGTGGQFDNLYSWSLRLQGAYLLQPRWKLFSADERWSVLAEGATSWRWEDGLDMSDGFTGGGSLAVGYRLGERFEVAAGASVGSKLLGSGIGIAPLVEFDWKINADWKLRSQGIGLQLERDVGEHITLFTRARLEGSSYRMADRGADVGKGKLRIRQVPVGAGFWWSMNRFVRVTAAGGVVAYHQLNFKSEGRENFGSVTATPSPYVLVRIDLRH